MTDTPLDLDAIEARAEEFRRWIQNPGEFSISDAEADAWGDRVPDLVAALRKAEAQVAAVLAECRKVATVSGNASGYPYVLVNTIVGAIERCVVTDERRVEVNPGLDIHLDRGPVE